MFENMWLQEESCGQAIQEIWEATYPGDPWAQVAGKIEACSEALSRWK